MMVFTPEEYAKSYMVYGIGLLEDLGYLAPSPSPCRSLSTAYTPGTVLLSRFLVGSGAGWRQLRRGCC